MFLTIIVFILSTITKMVKYVHVLFKIYLIINVISVFFSQENYSTHSSDFACFCSCEGTKWKCGDWTRSYLVSPPLSLPLLLLLFFPPLSL